MANGWGTGWHIKRDRTAFGPIRSSVRTVGPARSPLPWVPSPGCPSLPACYTLALAAHLVDTCGPITPALCFHSGAGWLVRLSRLCVGMEPGRQPVPGGGGGRRKPGGGQDCCQQREDSRLGLEKSGNGWKWNQASQLSTRGPGLLSVGFSTLNGAKGRAPRDSAPWPLSTRPLQLLSLGDHLQHLRVRRLPTVRHPGGGHDHPARGGHVAVRVAGLRHPQTAAHGEGPQVQGLLDLSVQEVPKGLCVFPRQVLSAPGEPRVALKCSIKRLVAVFVPRAGSVLCPPPHLPSSCRSSPALRHLRWERGSPDPQRDAGEVREQSTPRREGGPLKGLRHSPVACSRGHGVSGGGSHCRESVSGA